MAILLLEYGSEPEIRIDGHSIGRNADTGNAYVNFQGRTVEPDPREVRYTLWRARRQLMLGMERMDGQFGTRPIPDDDPRVGIAMVYVEQSKSREEIEEILKIST